MAENHRVIASYYKSGDYFKFADDFGFRWNTDLLNFNWRWSINDNLVSSTRFVTGDYSSQLFDPSGADAAEVDNGMAYLQGNQTFYYSLNDKHNITFGADWVGYDTHPEVSRPLVINQVFNLSELRKSKETNLAFSSMTNLT